MTVVGDKFSLRNYGAPIFVGQSDLEGLPGEGSLIVQSVASIEQQPGFYAKPSDLLVGAYGKGHVTFDGAGTIVRVDDTYVGLGHGANKTKTHNLDALASDGRTLKWRFFACASG